MMQVWPAAFLQVGDPKPEPDLCFVLMPFGAPWSARTYRVLRDVIGQAGYRCRRADEYTGRVVMADIWQGINAAAFVVADLTDANPNVYYELGIAHVLGKEVVPLLQRGHEIPFDQRAFRILHYEDNSDGVEILARELPVWIRGLQPSDPKTLLAAGNAEGFNAWRQRERRSGRLSLIRLDLSGLDLQAVDLDDCVVSEGDFTGTNLAGATARACLLIRARLTSSTWQQADLRGAFLSEAEAQGADFRGCDLRRANLLRAGLAGADFRGANLAGAVVDRATYQRHARELSGGVGFDELIVEGD